MKNRSLMAIIISLSLCLSVLYPVSMPIRSGSAAVCLSATLLKIPANKTKVLKMKNTSRTVSWSIKLGKNLIALKNKKKTQVTIKAKKKGTAVVKAVIRYSSRNVKTYTCKVKVTNSQWECPGCGFVNTGNFCKNCGHARPTPSPTPMLVWPTPSPSGSPTASTSPTPTPVPADAMSDKYIWMCLNKTGWYNVQLYANSAAMKFYDNVIKRGPITYDMSPNGENEYAGYLEQGNQFGSYLSNSYKVSAGEVFLYGTDWVKLSVRDHETSAYPTRIGKIISEQIYSLEEDAQRKVDGRTMMEFRQM